MTSCKNIFLLAVTCIASFGTPLFSDTVITTKGERLEGSSTLTPAGVAISNKTIPLAELFSYTTTIVPKSPGLQLHLTSGAVLPLRHLQNNHDSRLRAVGIDNTSLDLPIADIAAITFKGSPELPAPPSALLSSGDLFPGILMHISDTIAEFQSSLFGPRTFSHRELAAISIRPLAPAETPHIVRLRDGTTSPVATLTLGDNALTFKPYPALPDRTYAAGELLSITRSPAFAARVPDQSLTPAGITLPLPPHTTALLLKARIAPDLLPIAKSRILILDGTTELFRSPPLTSLDDALQITVPTQGRTTLTFKLESTLPLAARAELKEIQLLPTR